MKSLKQIVQENFKFKINRDNTIYTYHPNSWEELRRIIVDRFKELGPGTKQEPIDFNDIDISRITTFYNESTKYGLFEDSNFEYIDVSDWDVSNIKNMRYLFFNSIYLKSVGDLSKWDVSNVENMRYMFKGCEKIEYIGDLSKWNVSNVKDMKCLFHYCKNLKSVGDLSNWDISNVECIGWMFGYCGNLKSIGDISNWNISNINDMNQMFGDSGIINKPKWYKE